MSVDAVNWALRQRGGSPVQRLVLMVLAAHAGRDDPVCWPSLTLIAAESGISRTTAIWAIKDLEACGALVAERSAGQATRYRLAVATEISFARPRATLNRIGRTAGILLNEPDQSNYPHPCGSDTGAATALPVVRLPHGGSAATALDQCGYPHPKGKEPVIEREVEPSAPRRRANGRGDDRGHRLPDEWEPSPEDLAWAADEYPAVDCRAVTAEFRRYWLALPGARAKKLDWSMTWQNRVIATAGRVKTNGLHFGGRRSNSGIPEAMDKIEREIDERNRRTPPSEDFGLLLPGRKAD